MLSTISVPQLAIIAVIVILLFGTKRIAQLGGDLGAMIKGFKKEVKDSEEGDYGLIDAAKDVRKVKKTADKVRKVF